MDHGKRRHNIVAEVLTELFEGKLKPGQWLRVEHLAQQYGVSVTPIRESLIELAGMGVIELQPNRGAVVRDFGPRQVREICHLRRILECEATRGACERIAPYELAVLEEELTKLVESPRSAQWSEETRRIDSQLHELIAERSGNERLAYEIGRYSVLYRMLADVCHRHRTERSNYSQLEENSEHLAIVKALIAGDAERAAAAMAAHIKQVTETLEQDLFEKDEILADMVEPFLENREGARHFQ